MHKQATENFTKTSKRAALAVATFGAFMGPFDGSVVTLALPSIGGDLGGNVVSLGWVATAYVLGLTICVIPFGRLADIRGRRRVYAVGVALFTMTSAICGLSPSLTALIATRFLQGVAAAMMAGNSIALLSTVFPVNERGKALGINTAAVYVGLALGPSLGGFLVENFGWRSVFFVNVPIGMLVIPLVLLKIQDERIDRSAEELDPIGIITYGLALSMILLGLTFSENQNSLTPKMLMLAGFVILALFLLIETQVASPLLDIRLFKNTPFAFSTLTALLNYSSVFGVSFIMSLYLQLIPGFGPEQAGLILLAQPVMMAVFSPLSGWLSDKIEPRIIASIGMAIVSASIFALSLLAPYSEWWDTALRLMALGTGHAFFSSPNTNATMSSVEKTRYGVAAAILSTMRFTGQAISLAVATSVLSANVGRVVVLGSSGPGVPVDAFMTGMRIALTMLSAICAAGVFTSLVRGKVRSSSKV